MSFLEDELYIIRNNLKDSALESDYPDIDRNIDFKTNEDYFNENPEDYILRVDDPNDYINNKDLNASLTDNNNPLNYRSVIPESTRKKQFEEIKKPKEEKGISITELIQKISYSLLDLMSELLTLPPDNVEIYSYYADIFSKDYRLVSLGILLFIISLVLILIST